MEQCNAFIYALGHIFLVGVDFNAKHQYWGSRLINPKGRELYQTIQEKQVEILSTGKPTYWPTGYQQNSKFTRLLYLQRGIA
jgi:hypothetical protein